VTQKFAPKTSIGLPQWMLSQFDRFLIIISSNQTRFSCALIERRGTCERYLAALRDNGNAIFGAKRVFLAVVDVYERRSPRAVSESGILLRKDASDDAWLGLLNDACKRMNVDPKLLSALAPHRPHAAKRRNDEGDSAPSPETHRGNAKTSDGIGWAISLPFGTTPR
jgi:hypothetical protein